MGAVQVWAAWREKVKDVGITVPSGLQLSVVFQRPTGAVIPAGSMPGVKGSAVLAVLLEEKLKVDMNPDNWAAQLQVNTVWGTPPRPWQTYVHVRDNKP